MVPLARNGIEQLLVVINDENDARMPADARLCLRMLEAQLEVVKEQILENDRRVRASAFVATVAETRKWHYGQRPMKGRTYRSDTWPYQPADAKGSKNPLPTESRPYTAPIKARCDVLVATIINRRLRSESARVSGCSVLQVVALDGSIVSSGTLDRRLLPRCQ